MEFFTKKNLERFCFKRRRHKVANSYVSRLDFILLGISNRQLIWKPYDEKGLSETQTNFFFVVLMHLCGPALSNGDILAIIAYTQKPR